MTSIEKSRRVEQIPRRDSLKTTSALPFPAGLPNLGLADSVSGPAAGLFPTDLPNRQWLQFGALGFRKPVSGIVYRLGDKVTNGMALGGIDTGCLDLETSGLLGYLTLFNTHVPRRGPLNLPLLGLSMGGKTWVLCDPTQIKTGSGDYQPNDPNKGYRGWTEKGYAKTKEPFQETPASLKLEGVAIARQIHYWG